GMISGQELPDGLRESSRLPEPIFTPAMKAHEGHDENISEERMADIVGSALFEKLKKLSLEIYGRACEMAEPRGIIVADTKFEFGLLGNEVVLIDEVLTPDSSRFWDVSKYKEGGAQESFDKQPVRDYVESIGWDKKPPAPQLPEEVIRACTSRYREAYKRITGRELT
ncbi:MAG: phosphoribosylaminoimidazolesuccinocarboxamide synthase, partial [Candidatus Micrarchaeota archaeon]